MSLGEHRITNVTLSVADDPGHGGCCYYYKIDADQPIYLVSLEIRGSFPKNKPLPGPGESYPELPSLKQMLVKDNQQVEGFLRKISIEFAVYELTNLETPHWLHPTSYTFSFRDSAGVEHGFRYLIDCSKHLDKRYKKLITAFENFFELKTISEKFYKLEEQAQKSW